MQSLTASKWLMLVLAVLALFAVIYLPGRHRAHAAERDFIAPPTEFSYEADTIDYVKPSPFTLPKRPPQRPRQ